MPLLMVVNRMLNTGKKTMMPPVNAIELASSSTAATRPRANHLITI
ncbi:unannotated protein [freshwater metagenome]|uniref:Unannotated protein n=1 Tax=freshwater metagenome TaxID=449393 RepID=A0A6J6G3X6_9ZZZZ